MAADPAYRRPGDTYFLGDYRIVDDLGMGGMASVHLARLDRDGGFQKWAAVKKIHAHLIEDDSFVTMFLDEARVAASISHPNVAAVFDLGKDGDTYWIAMEYLHGADLGRICDTIMAFPLFVLAMGIVAALGNTVTNIVIATAIITEATLSFLGVGVDPSTPSWGAMISDAIKIFETAWWFMLFPGLALLFTVLAFNILGDGFQDAINPRTSKG